MIRRQLLLLLLISISVERIVHGFDVTRLIEELRGNDMRLFRYDASDETKEKQADEKYCGVPLMEQAIKIILAGRGEESSALEYITLCVTDNPTNRAVFASYPGIHEAVINVIEQNLPKLETEPDMYKHNVAMACHAIYITSFANTMSHQEYISKGAVNQLMNVINKTVERYWEEDDEGYQFKLPYVTMWAGAALSNLAANYCANDGLCYYYWSDNGFELDPESGSILSNGQTAREIMLRDEKFLDLLADISCQGPTSIGDIDEDNEVIMAGVNAEIDQHESSWTIVPWAAASVLKNIALDPSSHQLLEQSIHCFCYLTISSDWLEVDNGELALRYLRRSIPCKFSTTYDDNGEFVDNRLCIDGVYHHADDYTCTDLEDEPSEEQCAGVDRNNVSAREVCCACGGGLDTLVSAPPGTFEEEL